MKKFDFSKEFGKIDPKYITEAEGEWKEEKKSWMPGVWSKVAAACAIVTAASVIFSNPAVQAAMKNLTLSIGETLGLSKGIENYTEILNTSQTDNGITVTLKEVVLDDGVLLAKVHAEKADSKEQKDGAASKINSLAGMGFSIEDRECTINGEKLDEYGSGSYLPYSFDDLNSDDLDENVYDAVLESRFQNSIDLGENPEVHLVIKADNEETLGGDPYALFTFDFTISHAELMNQTVYKELENVSIDTEKGVVKLTDFSVNKLQSTIQAEVPSELYQNYELELRGTDSKGNQVQYELSGTFEDEHLSFKTNFWGKWDQPGSEESGLLIPDMDSDYVTLQLYALSVNATGEAENVIFDSAVAEVGMTTEEVVEVPDEEEQQEKADSDQSDSQSEELAERAIIGGADGATAINIQENTDENADTAYGDDDFYITEENEIEDGTDGSENDEWEAFEPEIKIQIK